MTREEAKRKQEELGKHYNLGFWYGIRCEKCCGVFPKLVTRGSATSTCAYMCEVCGRSTAWKDMPWEAEKEWNEQDRQMTIFDFVSN